MLALCNAGVGRIGLSCCGLKSGKFGGIFWGAVHRANGIYSSLPECLTVSAGAWLEGPALELIIMVYRCRGTVSFILEDVARIAHVCEGGHSQVLRNEFPCRINMPTE